MPSLQLDLNELVPELEDIPATALQVAGDQAVQELRRQNSLWPVDSGRSKRGFYADVVGGQVIIRNRFDYAYYVERGQPAARTRDSAERTLRRPAARRRIFDAAIRGRVSRERSQSAEADRRRRQRDERIILEGGPDSALSREGRQREARRRFRNRRARRTYRQARALNNQPVRPWVRLSGAEIAVATRLANAINPDVGIGIDDILRARRGRPFSGRILSAALQLASLP